VQLPQTAPAKHTPHVLNFFRSSNNSVAISFDVRDAAAKTVMKKQTVTLQALTAKRRRLERSSPPAEDELMAEFAELEVEEAQEDEEGRQDVEWGMEKWRRLSSRRRGGGSSSRPRPSPSPSSSRSSSTLSGGARRRANPAAARRRGSRSEGKDQPSTGVGGSRFQNSNGQSWAYTSQSRLTSNFGGRTPQTTSYGYAGRSAYVSPASGGSSMTPAMYTGAALVGGVAVGAGAMYLLSSSSSYSRYSRYGRGNNRCSHSSGWSRSCRDCYQRYGDQCVQEGPLRSANRDDLMDTGFWPADWKSPLTVTVFSVGGVDFERSQICPPAGWTNFHGSEVLPVSNDLFLTMTEMAELGDELQDESAGSTVGAVLGSLVSICCCCCCLVAIFAICFKKAQRASNRKVADSSSVSGSRQVAHDQPIVVAASVVQPLGYGEQPVVMGSPVFQKPYQPGRPVG